ncbi:hypothetical protein FOQG_18752 [Fusarium oxysporum f. sp. raphani 54005]|uniref:DUF7918 domain-containing protein n=2 Tax=Fusarium oxysporum f. sp. raphani TaxID=96318 RepID=X0B423_FUSOX|nr:hypothetical protein FOQG_18752 [Fusarium oxysporum f. sp. raphani 54005]KAG7427894.1 hypothetical protein Forpi1262_v011108 [Fusarium oxysporum f. sp. raphani]
MEPRTGQAYSFEVTALPELEFPLGRDIFIARRRVTIPDGITKVESLVFADLSQVENASDEKFESDMEKMGAMGIIKGVVGFATKFEGTSPTLCDAPEEAGLLEICQKGMIFQGQHLTHGTKFKTVTTHQDAVEVDDIYTDGTDDVSVFYFHYHSNSS